jgi:hypothetical protein
MTAAGTPDIIACVPVGGWGYMDKLTGFEEVGPLGLFVGFETKMPDGGNPSPIQEHTHNKIRRACGVVVVPRSVQDAVQAIEALGWRAPPVDPDGTPTAI